MSASYESLSPNGHSSMITRIFQKIKSWVQATFQIKSTEMTYPTYKNLTTAQKEDGTIRFLNEVESENYFYYDDNTKTMWFLEGAVTYDDTTKTLWL